MICLSIWQQVFFNLLSIAVTLSRPLRGGLHVRFLGINVRSLGGHNGTSHARRHPRSGRYHPHREVLWVLVCVRDNRCGMPAWIIEIEGTRWLSGRSRSEEGWAGELSRSEARASPVGDARAAGQREARHARLTFLR